MILLLVHKEHTVCACGLLMLRPIMFYTCGTKPPTVQQQHITNKHTHTHTSIGSLNIDARTVRFGFGFTEAYATVCTIRHTTYGIRHGIRPYDNNDGRAHTSYGESTRNASASMCRRVAAYRMHQNFQSQRRLHIMLAAVLFVIRT